MSKSNTRFPFIRAEDIEKDALALIERLELPVPVDPELAAEMEGLHVVFIPGMERTEVFDGFLTNDCQEIYVSAEATPQRQRFTVAHELGHLILHGTVIRKLSLSTEQSWRDWLRANHGTKAQRDAETQANMFASAFLLPRPAVLDILAEHSQQINLQAISYRAQGMQPIEYAAPLLRSMAPIVASHFNVSEQAAEFALINRFGDEVP